MLKYKLLTLGWLITLTGMFWSIGSLYIKLTKNIDFNWWSILTMAIGYCILTYALVKETKEE